MYFKIFRVCSSCNKVYDMYTEDEQQHTYPIIRPCYSTKEKGLMDGCAICDGRFLCATNSYLLDYEANFS